MPLKQKTDHPVVMVKYIPKLTLAVLKQLRRVDCQFLNYQPIARISKSTQPDFTSDALICYVPADDGTGAPDLVVWRHAIMHMTPQVWNSIPFITI